MNAFTARKEPDVKEARYGFCFSCCGVRIGFRSNNRAMLEKFASRLPEILPVRYSRLSGNTRFEKLHRFTALDTGRTFRIYRGDELMADKVTLQGGLEVLEPQIRLTVAEFTDKFVFLHAGAVSWKGKAVIIPGTSFSGKSTLVAELVKRDCGYLSDEYAVIDKRGLVRPFPKKLSLRGVVDDVRQVDFDVEELGGKHRRTPVPLGYILVARYQKENAIPVSFERTTAGEGIMASVANSISVRQNPRLVLEVLSRVAGGAAVFRAVRGEASEFADFFLNYLEDAEARERAARGPGRRPAG